MCHTTPKSKNNKNRGKNCSTETRINEYSSQNHGARNKNHVILNSPPPGLDISHANTMRGKIQNRQKLKTQRIKILTPGETFIISTALVSINIKTTKSPPAAIFPKGKSPNHPSLLHVRVANNQVRIPQEKRGNIKKKCHMTVTMETGCSGAHSS